MFSRVLVASGVLRRRVARPVAWVLVPTLAASMAYGVTPPAQAAGRERPAVQDFGDPVRGRDGAVKPRTANPAARAALKTAPTVDWPAPGATKIDVVGQPSAAATPARAGGMPVGAAAPGAAADRAPRAGTPTGIEIQVHPRAASARARVDGPVLTVTRADGGTGDGTVNLTLGYAGFADAYGGDFGSRLRLVHLPDCALTTPDRPGCQAATPVASTNNTETDTVSADVAVSGDSGQVYALTAGDSSSQGTYAATTLAPSSKWSVAPSSGLFNWSYPLRSPPVPGGQTPQVLLSYSSQTVDGRTAATNNQGSWIGEGFSYETGYIERRYKPCQDDGHDTVADLCWAYDNATIVLNGSSGDLIKDSAGRWRMTSDQDWKIEPLTGASNGDNNGEYWKITTPDGNEYYFGLNRLPGWSAGKEETNSTWTVPVYGDDAGEPCYKSTFADAWCQQAWRWNLDYVRDVHDNVTSYFHARESNWYARGARTDVNGTEYHRGGWLKRIDYGQRADAVYTTNAPARVVFTTAERCLPSGTVDCDAADLNDTTAPYWPDVPWDRNCAKDTRCKLDQAAPSFWTRKRLTKVTTEIRSGTGWLPVDSWTLDHWLTDNADGSKTLWLNTITHTGHVGGTASVPSVQLIGEQLPNRVDIPGDNIDSLIRFRVNTIYTDAGGQIHVNYAPADCAYDNLPKPGESTRRCYPVKWNPSNGDPITDWFHKYVAHEVIETDRTGGAPDMVTRYDYLGDAAWRKAERDGITEDKYLTWSQWRGYGKVRITRGDGQFMTTKAEHTYLRGMDGDPLPGGGTRTSTVTDSTGAVHTDTDELAGHELETIVYDGAKIVSKGITVPWLHQTGSQTYSWGTRRSTYVQPGTVRDFTALAAGGWRETRTVNTYDTTHGRLVRVDDLGDMATAADDRCVRSTYVDNPDKWLYSYVSRAETVAVNCAANPNRATQVLSDVRTWFDGQEFGVAPTRGDPTRTEKLASHDGTTASYVTQVVTTFDAWGRPLTLTDAAGSTVTTVYTQTDGLTTKKEETGPISSAYKTTTEYAPAWGVVTSQVDPNGKRVDLAYDPLGRLSQAWLPDRAKSQGLTPSIKYTYLLRADAPVAVKTEKIENDGGYGVEYRLYDGHLRPRQIQTEGPDGGRLVADTFYTGTGQIAKTYATYYAAGTPSDRVLVVNNGDVDGQTFFEYDGADRITAEIFAVAGDERWRSTTSYGGDRTHVDPPAGGIPSTTITDARGQRVKLLQYKGGAPTGDHDEISYTYTPAGQLASLTDAAGNVWRWEYDQRSRKIKSVDPDAGTTTYTYDDLDRRTSTTDGRGVTLWYTYDKIGRETAVYNGAIAADKKIAAWTYDTIAKGELYAAVRYVDGKAYGVTYPTLDAMYRPLRTRYVIPSVPGTEELAGTYEFTTSYNRDGTVQGVGLPGVGGLPAEAVVFGYDDLQRATSMTGTSPYVTGTKYAQTGELLQIELNTGAKKAWLTWSYEEGTKRLAGSRLDRQDAPAVDIDAHYAYDPAGNLLSIADTPAGGQRDIQCFGYDYLRRLSQAWATDRTATDPCAGGPASTGVGGPAPYHHSYTYDDAGNRRTETLHGVGDAADTTRTYRYPDVGQPRSHSLTEVVESTPGGDRLYSYEYDEAGNTTGRDLAGTTQTLSWDPEGHLASVEVGGQHTSFVYGADGNRLLRKEPGATTLYLPGMELRLDHNSRVVDGTRFYSFGGSTVAVRGITGVTFMASDHHGTQIAAIDAASGEITHRRTIPFGEVRGDAPAGPWPGERGFVGGTTDATTGLTHLGAREYDPTTGRFISVDPIIDVADPQQINPYVYSNSNPLSFSDPDGLKQCGDDQCKLYVVPLPDGGEKVVDSRPGGKTVYIGGGRPSVGGGGGGGSRGGGGGGGGGGEDPAVAAAKRAAEQAKQRLIAAAKALGKIAMDELGITAALDCFTNGDLGACGEVAIDVATSFVGGLAGKLLRRYGVPWKWKKGAELVRKVWNHLGDLVSGVKDWFKNTKLAKALSKGCSNSFLPGTLVLLSDGSAKPIQNVDIGDVVLATDPETGRTEPKRVVATIVGTGSKHLVQLTVDTDGAAGGATGVVVATANHPFWVPRLREWVDAADLQPGQWLQTSAGTWVQVTAIERWTRTATVHNLTVAELHTYYVIAGIAPTLVHNQTCDYHQGKLGADETVCGPSCPQFREVPQDRDFSRLPGRPDPSEWRNDVGDPLEPPREPDSKSQRKILLRISEVIEDIGEAGGIGG